MSCCLIALPTTVSRYRIQPVKKIDLMLSAAFLQTRKWGKSEFLESDQGQRCPALSPRCQRPINELNHTAIFLKFSLGRILGIECGFVTTPKVAPTARTGISIVQDFLISTKRMSISNCLKVDPAAHIRPSWRMRQETPCISDRDQACHAQWKKNSGFSVLSRVSVTLPGRVSATPLGSSF